MYKLKFVNCVISAWHIRVIGVLLTKKAFSRFERKLLIFVDKTESCR